MKTQYYTATTLDGFIADSEHSLDWLFQFGDGSSDSYETFIADVGAIAMGSNTYQWLLKNEIYKNPEEPKPWPYEQPTWVFTTRTLEELDAANVRFVAGDVVPVFSDMQNLACGKNIWLVGGGELVGQFYDHGLLDEIILTIAPVTLGAGAPLLPRKIDPPLALVSCKRVSQSLVETIYEVVTK